MKRQNTEEEIQVVMIRIQMKIMRIHLPPIRLGKVGKH